MAWPRSAYTSMRRGVADEHVEDASFAVLVQVPLEAAQVATPAAASSSAGTFSGG